uniref:Uncharacterized protein n=1 Tax=Leptobrachium leishanense TaxID=445787 RepID=A0A8C5R2K6_9ANUR
MHGSRRRIKSGDTRSYWSSVLNLVHRALTYNSLVEDPVFKVPPECSLQKPNRWTALGQCFCFWCQRFVAQRRILGLVSVMATVDFRDELTCSICTDIYKDPVTLTCGHSFCLVCITRTWDNLDFGGYSCPECRQPFPTEPQLKRNLRLCNIVERFLTSYPEEGEVGIPCTHCIHSPVPAIKTCLHCEASLCENHLRVHSKSMEHILTEPTLSLGNRKCSVHMEILKYYCEEDVSCICVSCRLDGEHRGHQVEPLKEAAEKRKEKFRNILEKLTSQREETEKKVQNLQEQKRELEENAADGTERVTTLVRDIKEQLETLEKRVLREISRQKQQTVVQVSELIQKLETKRDNLSRKMADILDLCNTNDPLSALQGMISDTDDYYNAEEIEDGTVCDLGDIDEGLVLVTLHSGLAGIGIGVRRPPCIQESLDSPLDVSTSLDMLLDINTASSNVSVSGDLKTVSRSGPKPISPETLQRFEYNQVLGTRSFSSGRHYWEVEVSKAGRWIIGMVYPNIIRRGSPSWIGQNDLSWGLWRSYINQYSVIHDSNVVQLPYLACSQRLGVFLDYEAGKLSFYELCDPVRHLHTFTVTFTQPLYAGIGVGKNAWVRIVYTE